MTQVWITWNLPWPLSLNLIPRYLPPPLLRLAWEQLLVIWKYFIILVARPAVQTGVIFLSPSLLHYLTLSCHQLSFVSPLSVLRVWGCPLVDHHLGYNRIIHFLLLMIKWWMIYHIIVISTIFTHICMNPFTPTDIPDNSW